MEPTINSHTLLLSLKKAYEKKDPERCDIIIFKYPLDGSVLYVKRVIGLPGEKIEIRDGKIFINSNLTPLDEYYLGNEWKKDNDDFVFNVPDNFYLVLGDNRNSSLDSRNWKEMALDLQLVQTDKEASQYAFVKRENIVAKAVYQIFPMIKQLK